MSTTIRPAVKEAIDLIITSWENFDGKNMPVDEVNRAFETITANHTQAVALLLIVGETAKKVIVREHLTTLAIIDKAFSRKAS